MYEICPDGWTATHGQNRLGLQTHIFCWWSVAQLSSLIQKGPRRKSVPSTQYPVPSTQHPVPRIMSNMAGVLSEYLKMTLVHKLHFAKEYFCQGINLELSKVVVQPFNHSTQEAEARRSLLEASLVYRATSSRTVSHTHTHTHTHTHKPCL